MPPNNNNSADPYGFILNSSPKPPRKPLVNGSSMGVRIAVVAVGIILLIIIAVVVSSFLNQGKKDQKQKMLDVISSQTEIIRVSALAEKDIHSSTTLNYAKTTRLSVQSSQTSLSGRLGTQGISEKQLNKIRASAKNSKTDAALDSAKQNNRYDETYLKIINESLANYQKLLLAAAGGANSKDKQVLRVAYEGVNTLKKNDPKATPVSNDIVIDRSKPASTPSSIIDNDVDADENIPDDEDL